MIHRNYKLPLGIASPALTFEPAAECRSEGIWYFKVVVVMIIIVITMNNNIFFGRGGCSNQ